MRALILAAGLGERLRPLTLKRAKPAIEFLNVPMLGFPYHWLNSLGLTDLTFNTHYLPDTVRVAAMHVADPSIALHFTHETAILGSGGGIAGARIYLQGERTFAVANGDGVLILEDPNEMKRMLEFHESHGALATLLVCPLEGVGTRIPGVWMNAAGEVTNFGKAAGRPELSCFHYASIMLFDQRIFKDLPDGPSNILYDVLEPRIAAGEKVYGYRVDRMKWFETGNIADYLAATGECLGYLSESTSVLSQSLRGLLDKHAPAFDLRSDLCAKRMIANTAQVSESARLEGFAVVGPDANVGNFARLSDAVVLPGARVAPDQVHKQDVIISV